MNLNLHQNRAFKWSVIPLSNPKCDKDKIWEQYLSSMSNKIDKPTLALLKSLKPYTFNNNKLILLCPTEQTKEWITKSLGNIMNQEALSMGFRIELLVKEQNKPTQNAVQSHYVEDAVENVKAKQNIIKEGLSLRYTFDNFIVGTQNEVAYKCAMDVSTNPKSLYNPLFIYGKIGSGKTHLLQAIGNRAYLLNKSVIYISMNDFSEEMVYHLKSGSIMEFRAKYKNIDILLIDDIQFLSGKERTQIELFNVFNYLFQSNKHIVFASDKHPRDIKDISERLVSRFEGGLLVETGIDEQLKLSIIKQKIQVYGLNVDERLISYIKDNTTNNAREIEGLVLQIKAKGSAMLEALNQQTLLYSKKKEITISLIKELVAQHFNISIDVFNKSHKNKKYAIPKHISIFLAREYTTLSLSEIAKEFNIKSHSSINHSIKKIVESLKQDKTIQYSINIIRENIKKHVI